jgi:hypothetical protein
MTATTSASQERKARAKVFKEIGAEYRFTSEDIQRFAQQCRRACWIKDHLGGYRASNHRWRGKLAMPADFASSMRGFTNPSRSPHAICTRQRTSSPE